MTRLIYSLSVYVISLAFPLAAAWACPGTKSQFEDDFKVADSAWGTPNENLQIGDGKLTFKLKQNDLYWSWNGAFAFTSGVACATFKILNDTADPKNSAAAIMFWVKDNQNFYTFKMSPSGDYWIGRLIDNKWVASSMGVKNAADIKKGKDATNEIGVKFDGQQVTLYLNDKELTKIRAQSPDGQSFAGVYAQSAEKSADIYEMSNFKVMTIDPAK